LEPKNEVF